MLKKVYKFFEALRTLGLATLLRLPADELVGGQAGECYCLLDAGEWAKVDLVEVGCCGVYGAKRTMVGVAHNTRRKRATAKATSKAMQ